VSGDELEGIREQAEAVEMAVHLQEIKRVLQDGTAKVEFSFAFGASGTVQTAQVWEKKAVENRYGRITHSWRKVGPFLTTKEGTRASLLEFLAHLAKKEEPQ
jgi:hypothetical protein